MGRVAASPENAAAFMTATLDIDVRKLARQILAPTLVVHVRGDQVVPFDSGRELAALIPGARMAVIEGRDHIPVPGDGEQEQLVQAVFPFLDEDTQKAATTGSSTRFIARARNGKGRAYRSFVSTTR
jgi:pimeloyl-ACP methyl ester carboxylesterase